METLHAILQTLLLLIVKCCQQNISNISLKQLFTPRRYNDITLTSKYDVLDIRQSFTLHNIVIEEPRANCFVCDWAGLNWTGLDWTGLDR